MTLPVEFLLILAALSQQVTENFFGPYLDGPKMKFVSLAVCIGLAFAAWAVGFAELAGRPWPHVLALGAFAGLGSNVVHGLVRHFAPEANSAPLATLLAPKPEK